MTRGTVPGFFLAAFIPALISPALAQTGAPSRAADTGCAWEKLSDTQVGLAAWVERCDFGFRQIDLHFEGNAVVQKYSDGGAADPVITIFDLEAGETIEAGLRRIYDGQTDAATAARCALASSTLTTPPKGVERFSFVPDAAYAAELAQSANPDEVPEPPCGELGDWPDGVQYFEVHPDSAARKILFVIAGQDSPLFDDQTLELLLP